MEKAEVVLAAIAARTSRIRLTNAVSVISSDDPVRAASLGRPMALALSRPHFDA